MITTFASGFAILAGVRGLLSVRRKRHFSPQDLWLSSAAVLVLMVITGSAGGDSDALLSGAVLAGLGMMAFTFPVLAVAAFRGKEVADVGVLVPIYLFAAALGYPAITWLFLDLHHGALC